MPADQFVGVRSLSKRPCRHRCRNRSASEPGFSLIELLVAVLVIVLLTSVVALNVGTGGQDILLQSEVESVAATLAYAQVEAEFSGADHGLLIESEGMGRDARFHARWRRRFDQGWAPLQVADDALSDIEFIAGFELLLSLDGQPDVTLERDPDLTNPPPQIQVFAGGEVTPGSLEWLDATSGDVLWRIEWDLFGRMSVLPRGEPVDES